MSLLDLRNVSKKFGGLTVLKDVSFQVEHGQVVGLIGPNGAGKSTIFNIVTGFIKPDTGRIFFEGKEVSRLKPYEITKLGVARTFQSVRPFPDYNVEENVRIGALFGRNDGKGIDERVEYALELTGLTKKRKEAVSSLPIQQRKLVEVARAVASSPVLLLLDEPMAGFNTAEVEGFSDIVRKINERGVTILIVEHVMKAVMGLSEKVVVLNAGMKIAEGRPDEVTKNGEVISAYLGDSYA